MKIIAKVLTDPATYWPPGLPGDDGVLGFGDPVAVKVRWVAMDGEAILADGTKKLSKYNVMINIDVAVGGMLAHVPITDASVDEGPAAAGAREILSFAKVPTIKGRHWVRRVVL